MHTKRRPWRPQLTRAEMGRGWVFFALYLTVFPLSMGWVQRAFHGELPVAEANVVYYLLAATLVFLVFWTFLRHGFDLLLDWLPENLFAFGTVMGGVYEYVCSAVTELLFGTVFWDYSKFKFNLGGRINLLYCFFWGIAAVMWMRYGYPLVLKLMKKVRSHIRPWMTAMLAVFMAVNMLTSALALARYDARTSGEAPNGQLEVFLDEHFDNARMERIYPNAKKVIKAE